MELTKTLETTVVNALMLLEDLTHTTNMSSSGTVTMDKTKLGTSTNLDQLITSNH
jgi:hypothetical protein